MQKLILVAFALLCGTAAFGQVSTEDIKARAENEKLKDLVIGYNRNTDRTVVITKPVELLGGAVALARRDDLSLPGSLPEMLFITIGYEGKGDGLQATPDKLTIAFTSNSRDWPFLKGDSSLYIMCDERRMKLRPAPEDEVGRKLFTGQHYFERLVFEISRDELEYIITAKKIEMKLGGSSPKKWNEDRVKQVQAILAITTVTK